MNMPINTRTPILLLMLSAFLVLSGCASGPKQLQNTSSLKKIDAWVANELTPYLQKKMVKHPRFMSEPVAIVPLMQGRVAAQSNALVSRIRRDLEDQLLQAGGITLIWKRPDENNLQCTTADDAHYFLGLEVFEQTSEINIRVRMLDVRDNSFVDQFAMNYRDDSDDTIHGLLQDKLVDESLKGSRHAPFAANELDLASQRLAHKLGCEVDAFSGGATAYFEEAAKSNEELVKITAMARNYLSQQSSITLSHSADSADFLIRQELQQVDAELAQLWLKPRTKDTAAVPASVNVYIQHALVSALSTLDDTASTTQAPVPLAPTPVQETPVPSAVVNLVDDFKAYIPAKLEACEAGDPWRFGELALSDNASLPSKACFVINYRLNEAGYVYLLHEGPDGSLMRLLPDNCDLSHKPQPSPKADYWYPGHSKDQQLIIELDEQSGTETFHLIAVDNDRDSESIRESLRSLPSPDTGCNIADKGIVIRQLKHNDLQRQTQRLGAPVKWQTRRINHY